MTGPRTNLSSLKHKRSNIAKIGRIHHLHWLVVTLSLALTGLVWHQTEKYVDEKSVTKFNLEAARMIQHISDRMQKYEDGLWGGISAVKTLGGNITLKEWQTYTSHFQIEKKYPGIHGMGIIYYLKRDQLHSFLAKQRKERPHFNVYPEHDKEELWPITYIEPVHTNQEAVGLDMAHEVNRYTAAQKARDTGISQITGPIILVQDEEKSPGFLFFEPFYTESYSNGSVTKDFVGLVYAPFVMKRLMQSLLDKENRLIGVAISDEGQTLFDEHSENKPDFDPNPMYQKLFNVQMHGREWVFDIRTTKAFRQVAESYFPIVVLCSGLIINAVLLLHFILIGKSKKRAIIFADAVATELESRTVELERSNEETEGILSSISLILIGIDQNDVITRWNTTAEVVFGFPASEMLGKSLIEAPIDWNWVEVLKFLSVTHESSSVTKWDNIPFKNIKGDQRLLNITVNPVKNNQTDLIGLLILAEDITEYSELERQLTQAQKLQSVGQLAAGIAHEINTPIQFIGDNIHFLKDAFKVLIEKSLKPSNILHGEGTQAIYNNDPDDQQDQSLQMVLNEIPGAIISSLDGIQRVSEIVKAVKSFSHPGSDQKSLVNINDSIEKAVVVSRNEWKYVADIKTEFDMNLPHIPCYPRELNQVFLNIIVNAAQAIADGKDSKNDKGEIRITTFATKEFVQIDFLDDGPGIPEEIQDQIFNPFFTTKEIGKGTGQGLSLGFDTIVRKHGGAFKVQSNLGEGALFTIKLPLNDQQDRSLLA